MIKAEWEDCEAPARSSNGIVPLYEAEIKRLMTALANERERCAQICEQYAEAHGYDLAARIRSVEK